MDVIYQAADEDFNFFQTQARELDAERNKSISTSLLRTITGTRHKTGRRQVTGIPSMPITPGVASPTIIPSVATSLGMPVIIRTTVQHALAATTVLDTPAMAPAATEIEHELSLPETILPVHPSTNESQLGAYLNNHVHHIIQNTKSSCAVQTHMHRKILKVF